MIAATCHPTLEHVAKGLCANCYQNEYRREARGTRRRYNAVMPVFEPDERRVLPSRTAGVRQNAVTAFPVPECPKCNRQGTMSYHGREARCAGALGGCGQTLYLVSDSVPETPSFVTARLLRRERALRGRTSGSIQRPFASTQELAEA